ncbi:bifunctional 4-hydroxy-2-oxoglutarate aldolase/2-dehydro-3-deoxy-phosphogluconate aldolase [Gracilibacillus caseinilyticus]|uniref:Bifunctional 4-hydroxy-2-oxoglutarate aldolase/2-dehydro-3-deoxy-phosphogluconate aldolase n=1 Tax=Gracilibacillus caseinilyticus TaxID=2932256 RepID=A0ABY4F0P7_9BACI|nr:bifunctional 4-hydroxy-2-oxoglutarate aldolase/2-dehydro-3-deoxy-phosphogluconate aldolase [Gracilibacillus caseinilyticus]UOQ50100.1 bifunctional 4-hydroxy-2-oxoglutarate aldolase/2-dehydro-3-deoxy-phosphogluconate aldolase [Gracilibacillus caseinilyticus]
METLQNIYQHKLVAIIRGVAPKDVMDVTKALYEGGIRTLEITADTPKVLEIIEKVRTEFHDEMIVGAGTVLDAETARAAIMAGSQFIFSPTVDIDTIKLTKRYGVVSIPGAMTPTEILTAYENGGDLIKVFPATILGPTYLKDIKGPMPHIPLMPTGGVNLDNISDYFKVGAKAAGLGSALVRGQDSYSAADLQALTARAQQFTAKL